MKELQATKVLGGGLGTVVRTVLGLAALAGFWFMSLSCLQVLVNSSWYPVTFLGQCGVRLTSDSLVHFGTLHPQADRACEGYEFLRPNWNPREETGVWSAGNDASVIVPVRYPRDISQAWVELAVNTYVGLGFTQGNQKVTIKTNFCEQIIINFREPGSDRVVRIPIPGEVFNSLENLNLRISVNKTFNPSAIGVSDDKRDLGVFLRTLEVKTIE